MGKRKNVTAPQNYVVERVLDRYVDELGNKWYQLKWLGFPAEQATWEPESNVDCTSLVKKFEDGLKKPKLVLKKKKTKQGAAEEEEEEEEWSLKRSGTGSSTKIVLKKVNLGKTEICSRDYNQAHLFSSPTNGVSEPTPCELPGRHSKRRRSSTIGVEVAPKKKRTARKKKSSSTVDPVATESAEEYMVEAILDKCLGANGVILYHIKWIGFDHIYNTWEPVENLSCPQILHAFNQRCKQPKVTVSKILDKRRVENRIEYLVKISGCRKDTWMFETELHCTDLLDDFNRTYRAKQAKVSLADIADDYVSESEETATNSTKGVKTNKECETSSDDSVNFSVLLPKKKKPLQNGKVRAKSRSKSPVTSSSSSGSGADSDDFGDLLKKINKSVEEDNFDSAPPSPPEEMVSPVKQEPGRSDKVIPETVKKLARLKKEPSPTPEADSFHVVKKEEFVIKPSSPSSSAPIAPPTEISPPQSQELVEPTSSPVVSDDDDKKVPSTTYTPFLPDLIIPARSPVRKPTSRDSPRREVSPSPVYGYPGSLTSDRSRDPSKPEYTPTKTPNSLASFLPPSQSASDDSDSDESLSELENNLTKALKEEAPSGPPNQSFSGVDLGALLLTEADKTTDTSMSGLLDTIVSQTVTNSLHTAFLDTSVSRDISHSELFAVVAQHSHQPSEKDIDFMLGDLYETASSSKETSRCESDGEREVGFCSPTADFVSDDEETEPLDPPLNSILSLGPGHSAQPRPPPKEPKKQRSAPPKKVDPPFTAFSGLLSTFAKPSKRPKKADKPTKAEKPVKLEKTDKPVKSVKPQVRTFSKKTPKTSNKPSSIFTDDIFSDIGSLSTPTKKSYAASSSPCPFCARKFKDRTKLDFHISNKHPQMLEMHCEGCGEFFQSAIEYQCHQMTGCGNGEG